PPEIRTRIVELMGDLPRIELFARKEDSLFEHSDWVPKFRQPTGEKAAFKASSAGDVYDYVSEFIYFIEQGKIEGLTIEALQQVYHNKLLAEEVMDGLDVPVEMRKDFVNISHNVYIEYSELLKDGNYPSTIGQIEDDEIRKDVFRKESFKLCRDALASLVRKDLLDRKEEKDMVLRMSHIMKASSAGEVAPCVETFIEKIGIGAFVFDGGWGQLNLVGSNNEELRTKIFQMCEVPEGLEDDFVKLSKDVFTEANKARGNDPLTIKAFEEALKRLATLQEPQKQVAGEKLTGGMLDVELPKRAVGEQRTGGMLDVELPKRSVGEQRTGGMLDENVVLKKVYANKALGVDYKVESEIKIDLETIGISQINLIRPVNGSFSVENKAEAASIVIGGVLYIDLNKIDFEANQIKNIVNNGKVDADYIEKSDDEQTRVNHRMVRTESSIILPEKMLDSILVKLYQKYLADFSEVDIKKAVIRCRIINELKSRYDQYGSEAKVNIDNKVNLAKEIIDTKVATYLTTAILEKEMPLISYVNLASYIQYYYWINTDGMDDVEIDAEEKEVIKKKLQPLIKTSWQNLRLINLGNMSIEEARNILQEKYRSYTTLLSNSALSDIKNFKQAVHLELISEQLNTYLKTSSTGTTLGEAEEGTTVWRPIQANKTGQNLIIPIKVLGRTKEGISVETIWNGVKGPGLMSPDTVTFNNSEEALTYASEQFKLEPANIEVVSSEVLTVDAFGGIEGFRNSLEVLIQQLKANEVNIHPFAAYPVIIDISTIRPDAALILEKMAAMKNSANKPIFQLFIKGSESEIKASSSGINELIELNENVANLAKYMDANGLNLTELLNSGYGPTLQAISNLFSGKVGSKQPVGYIAGPDVLKQELERAANYLSQQNVNSVYISWEEPVGGKDVAFEALLTSILTRIPYHNPDA
ncbi:MAG: hypothetical protein ABIB11_01335, partial [Candidatus Omnitrophota bacterium]